MITPTIGRVVWFWPQGRLHTEEPNAAIIVHVSSDDLINVVSFEHDGVTLPASAVYLHQDDDTYGNPGGGPWARWMPYQKGQAAKTEKVESDLEAAKRMASAGNPLI